MSQDQFRKSEDQFFLLKGQLAAGRITQSQFDAALKALMIQDAQGRYWMIGEDTGKRYVHDGQTWVETNPSVVSAPPVPESYAPAPQPSRGINRMVWLALGLVLIVCLLGTIGLGLVINQGILRISMDSKPTITPFPTFAPVIPTVPVVPTIPIIPTVGLPSPIPSVVIAQPPPTVPAFTSTVQPTPTASPSRITFKFDTGVTQPERDEIQNNMPIITRRLGDVGDLWFTHRTIWKRC